MFHTPRPAGRLVAVAAALLGAATPALAQMTPARVNKANWELAEKFSPDALRRVTYSAGVQPRWIGKSDSMWYNWRDRSGSTFFLVLPVTKVKRPLFDHLKLASALSGAHRKPYDPNTLPFNNISWTKDHKNIRFTVDSSRYEWNLAAETLKSIGRPPRPGQTPDDEEQDENQGGGRRGGGGGRGGRGGGVGGANQDFRNFSPDSTAFVFAREHNLFIVEVGKTDTLQLSRDGATRYSFGFRDTVQTQQQLQQQQEDDQQDDQDQQQGGQRGRDPRVRANVTWSRDSKAFFVQRNDARKVKDLYLVNTLAEPRPTLTSYQYAMPGEENVPQQELWSYKRGEREIKRIDVAKWKDQRLYNTHWTPTSDKMRLIRRDRLQRNLEMIEVDIATNAVKTLIPESVESANLEGGVSSPRYTKTGGDIIWWSERSGWGHYYLYDYNGNYKRPLTSGAWRADNIVQIDTIGGVIYLSGVGREPGENLYFRHLYKVNADGTGFALLDQGAYNHTASLAPTFKYFVDNHSKMDSPTKSVLRNSLGQVVMDLQETDVSQLKEMGWRPPEPYVVKAADGVTDIYGNIWRPFDFDSTKKYPIIAYVYPGPQQEAVSVAFSPGGLQQQVAQLGFIVIQIGHRGGTPLRSNQYQSFSYFNLRDYALADKKAGIEQLAAKYPWIDIDRVGIWGHSGGGFLTGAAMLLPPYNEFFKVGWSEAGNHDNNVYNQNWSEQYHGLKLVPVRADSGRRGRVAASGSSPSAPNGDVAAADDSVKFEIHVPANHELAANLKGRLMIIHGEMDNNVHPAGSIRLANALLKANKRFDFMLLPGTAHGFGQFGPWNNRALMEYFAEHLLGDYYRSGAEIK